MSGGHAAKKKRGAAHVFAKLIVIRVFDLCEGRGQRAKTSGPLEEMSQNMFRKQSRPKCHGVAAAIKARGDSARPAAKARRCPDKSV